MEEQWKPISKDLVLSTIIAVGFPFLAQWLYNLSGALLPMILYYGLAWGIVKWRRGETGYFRKIKKKNLAYFWINTGVIVVGLVLAYFARVEVEDPDPLGVSLTALIWAPLNASSEQLLWIYIFESWDLYRKENEEDSKNTSVFRIIGLILFTVFVGTIHTFFWVKFLHTVNPAVVAGAIFVVITSISGYLHIIVWRKTKHMIFTFIPHLLLNLFPLFWTGYSMLPYLLK